MPVFSKRKIIQIVSRHIATVRKYSPDVRIVISDNLPIYNTYTQPGHLQKQSPRHAIFYAKQSNAA